MQLDDLSHVWIGATDGELVRADRITGLRCAGGSTEAHCSDGRMVQLAGSGCPADFHARLLAELARARAEPRWFVIIAAEPSRDGAQWVTHRIDDLVSPPTARTGPARGPHP